jgi:hypothetical protein
LYSSAAHACCGLWLQVVVLAAPKKWVSPKFNGCSMPHGARILARKWREGVTPNGCRPFSPKRRGRSTAADLPSRPGALPRARASYSLRGAESCRPHPVARYNGITVRPQSAHTGHECLFETRYQHAVWIVSMLMTGNGCHPFLTVAYVVVDYLRLVVRNIQEPKDA